MQSKCGHLDIPYKIFDEMPTKIVICWTSIISGYVKCSQLDEATELFDRTPVKDIVRWTAMPATIVFILIRNRTLLA